MEFSSTKEERDALVFSLDVPDPRVRLRNVCFSVISANWLAQFLGRFIRLETKCTWEYEELK